MNPPLPMSSCLRVLFRVGCGGLLIGLLSMPAGADGSAVDPNPSMPHFAIFEYEIEGNSLLSDSEIERAVTPFLGEGKTLKEVEAARAALENSYHDAGYLTAVVSIPEQNVDAGSIALNVVEGEVNRLRVKGSQYHLPSGIKNKVPELAEGSIPYFPEVQRELEILNRSPDLKATPVLKAGKTPGTVDVSLDVDDQLPLHGSVELSNRQSPFTQPLRLSASVRYDNLWQLGHSFSLTAQTAPQATEQVKVLAGTYVMPVGGRGDVLALYAVHSSSNVPSFPTGVLGNSDIAGLRYTIALPATADYSQSLSLGFDYKDVKQSLVVGGPSGPTTDTPSITYVPLAASYNGAWLQNSGSTALDATVTLGMRRLFGNHDEDFAAKRSGASADFVALRTGLRQTETFKRWALSGRVEMQIASGPLVPNEQYAAGGAESVRGYEESERLGDDAFRFGLELRTPELSIGSDALPLRITGLGFFDAADLRTLQPLFPQPEHYRIRGVGIGLRLIGPAGLGLDLDLAKALDDGQTTRAGDFRVHSRLVWDF